MRYGPVLERQDPPPWSACDANCRAGLICGAEGAWPGSSMSPSSKAYARSWPGSDFMSRKLHMEPHTARDRALLDFRLTSAKRDLGFQCLRWDVPRSDNTPAMVLEVR